MRFFFSLCAFAAFLCTPLSTAAQEARINTMGGNPYILPDDRLNMLLFPHLLEHQEKKFLYADVSNEYFIYSGKNYFISMGRDQSDIPELHPNRTGNRATLDIGRAKDGVGVLASIMLATRGTRWIDANLKYSRDMGDRDVRVEAEVLSVQDGDTGYRVGGLMRRRGDWFNGTFNIGLVGAAFEDLGKANNFARTIDVHGGLARNQMVDQNTKLVYSVFVQFSDVADGDMTISVPMIFATEYTFSDWLILRAGAEKNWNFISPDTGDSVFRDDAAVFGYGLRVKRGPFSLHFQFDGDIFAENPLGGDSDFSRSTSLVIELP